MKRLRLLNKKRFVSRFLTAGILVLCAVMTGCTGREAEFLAEETLETEDRAEAEIPKANEAEQVPAEIYVDVCGAVAKPGVFRLEEGSRVFQAIEAAGGYLPEAAQDYINRAVLLSDGQQIYVPTEKETEEADFSGREHSGGEALAEKTGAPDGMVNLNTADEAELMTLTGIGATRAQAIISYREENGPFTSIEDIMNVQGIKEGTFTKIKNKVVVG